MRFRRRMTQMCSKNDEKEGEKRKQHPELVPAAAIESKPKPEVKAVERTDYEDILVKSIMDTVFHSNAIDTMSNYVKQATSDPPYLNTKHETSYGFALLLSLLASTTLSQLLTMQMRPNKGNRT
ncbi:unnamed protein product [Hymenolepis diminuta]|uniref:Uncharacterized protein n=1 Tax=Hymenolepis diminuta TaxID=6216 RepID=A0A564Y8Z7_HYMDI|nr:unnamed protein product [Hymenolepis diminuta]VUZ43775.1 unnamed protein product [Hymenolepis diminuta]VUZ52414.1 unnamed protein product [Hymenolepis diminuta]VUZ53934.1 unnamed protein product [Hymenolepis diminuta]